MKIRDRIKELRRVKASELFASPKNWRTHPRSQQEALKGVLAEIGYADALLARERENGDLELIDGHLRAETTPNEMVPVLVLDVNEDEAATLLAVLDPMAGMAETNTDALGQLLHEVGTNSDALKEMLEGVADREGIDMFEGAAEDLQDAEPQLDRAAELQEEWGTELGQLWVIPGKAGDHRLLCGDSTKAENIKRLMNSGEATLIHADPPYGMGKEKDGIANDNLYREKLDVFQMAWWTAARPSLVDNGSAYIWGNAEDLWRLWYAGGLKDSERFTFRNEIAWDKGGGGFGVGTEAQRCYFPEERCLFFMLGEQGFNNNADNYWEGWEPIRLQLAADCEAMGWGTSDIKRITGVGNYSHWFTKSQWVFIPEEHYLKLQEAARDHDAFKRDYNELKLENDELKQDHDKLKQDFYATRAYFDNAHDNMTDVWKYPRVTGEDRHDHATPKPVEMICRIIKSSSAEGDCTLEPFLGSGTTMVAAENLSRVCYGLELEPKYLAVILQRMKDLGLEPKLEK